MPNLQSRTLPFLFFSRNMLDEKLHFLFPLSKALIHFVLLVLARIFHWLTFYCFNKICDFVSNNISPYKPNNCHTVQTLLFFELYIISAEHYYSMSEWNIQIIILRRVRVGRFYVYRPVRRFVEFLSVDELANVFTYLSCGADERKLKGVRRHQTRAISSRVEIVSKLFNTKIIYYWGLLVNATIFRPQKLNNLRGKLGSRENVIPENYHFRNFESNPP